MKQVILSVFASFLVYNVTYSQTTATDFTVNDCVGTSHNLFSELDAGKIIVIAWVMPCGSCGAPALSAYNAVQSYTSSNPGTVLFYLVDDYANTSCSTLTSWANNNSMPNATKFSNSAISMSDYGADGMPKIVVLGGANHGIAYNQNSGVTTSGVQSVINNLLASSVSINEIENTNNFNLKVMPNPVKGNTSIEYTLDNASSVQLEIFSVTGELVYETKENNQVSGNHKLTIEENSKLNNGMYILKLTTSSKTESINFVVEK